MQRKSLEKQTCGFYLKIEYETYGWARLSTWINHSILIKKKEIIDEYNYAIEKELCS